MCGGDAGGRESGLAPRHRRSERSKTGARMSDTVTGSATSPSRPLRYFAGTADRWVALPMLRGDANVVGRIGPESKRHQNDVLITLAP